MSDYIYKIKSSKMKYLLSNNFVEIIALECVFLFLLIELYLIFFSIARIPDVASVAVTGSLNLLCCVLYFIDFAFFCCVI